MHPTLPNRGPATPAQNHKSQNIHVIFLAITTITTFSWQFSFHPNGCQDLTNQYVQKIQQIPKICKPINKISKFENPNNKTPKKTQQIWLTKKKKKTNPNHIDYGSVTGEGWFTVVVEIFMIDESFDLLTRCLIA